MDEALEDSYFEREIGARHEGNAEQSPPLLHLHRQGLMSLG